MLIDVKVDYAKAGETPVNWQELVVLLNGKEMKDVVEVNCPEGWLRRYKRRYNGHHYLDLHGRVATETLHGHVVCYYTKEIPNSAK